MAVGRLDEGIEWESLGEGNNKSFVMFAVNDKRYIRAGFIIITGSHSAL